MSIIIGLVAFFLAGLPALPAKKSPAADVLRPRITKAVMCELLDGYEPKSVAIVFSITVGRISCYTAFDQVPDTTYIDHRWYRRDELVTTKRLTLKTPSWSTYSSIQLRAADKGPWRVEIWSADDRLMKTLRFSVTD